MKTLTELNADDIRKIIAIHFELGERDVHVGETVTALIWRDIPRELEEKDAENDPAQEMDVQAAPRRTSRVERLFGKREDWQNTDVEPEVRGVKGFLIVKCSCCESVKTAFLKDYQTTIRCRECGGEIPVADELMIPVYTKCPACNNTLRYKTNLTSDRLTVKCRNCGFPIDCKRNSKKTAYNTYM